MAGEFADSPGKRSVRELWDTPVLRYLHEQYSFRYRYVGLPGSEVLDIKLWQDMIDEVVAFEMSARPTEDDPEGLRNVATLRRNLTLLGVKHRVFYGPLEEVIILRTDLDGQPYQQKQVMTLCNLDFCDEIVSKIRTRREGGRAWRFEAIRRLLADQRDCFQGSGGPGFFLILLTVKNQIDAAKLQRLLDSATLHYDTRHYVDFCNGEGPSPLPTGGSIRGTHTWALKAFLHQTIRGYLTNPNISAVFFPVVKYTGKTANSHMLHWIVLCRFENPELHAPMFLPQEYLTTCTSVRANNDHTLVWEGDPGEVAHPSGSPSGVEWFMPIAPDFMHGATKQHRPVQT